MKSVVWYDKLTRLWVAQILDGDGNQLGNAEYSGTRDGAVSELAWMGCKIGQAMMVATATPTDDNKFRYRIVDDKSAMTGRSF